MVFLSPSLPTFPTLPLPAPYNVTIPEIVNFEFSLFTAQLSVPGVGRLDAGGARGGPEKLSQMVPMPSATVVAGLSYLFDAGSTTGTRGAGRSSGARSCSTISQWRPRYRPPVQRLPQLPEQRHQRRQYPLQHRHRVGGGPHAGPDPAQRSNEQDVQGERLVKFDRRWPRQRHRPLDRPRQVQDADDPGPCRARAVLPQQHRRDARGRGSPLRAILGFSTSPTGSETTWWPSWTLSDLWSDDRASGHSLGRKPGPGEHSAA